MARTAATSNQDTLGLLAMGSIIVNLAQGEAQKKLAAWYASALMKIDPLVLTKSEPAWAAGFATSF
jgi:hypothetical protein